MLESHNHSNLCENPGHPAVTPTESPSDDFVEVEACPVCGSCIARPRFSINGIHFTVVVCADCGLGQLHPRPTDEEIQGFYHTDYYGTSGTKFESDIELLVRWVGSRHANFLTKHLRTGARVLDLGCGRGVLLRALLDQGFEAHGVEISRAAAEGADPRAEIRIASRLAEANYPNDYFDEVIVWHVLEHLPDPREALEEIRRLLKPGGRLVIAVPNFSSIQSRWAGAAWFHLDLPRHLFHFPVGALCQLITDCGFECKGQHHFSLRQNPFGWIQSYLNRSRKLPRNGLYTLLHHRDHSKQKPFDFVTRFCLRLAFWVGMPIALVLGIVETAIRSGPTVHVVARRPND